MVEVLTHREFVSNIELERSGDEDHFLSVVRDQMATKIGREIMKKFGKERVYMNSRLIDVRITLVTEAEENLINLCMSFAGENIQ